LLLFRFKPCGGPGRTPVPWTRERVMGIEPTLPAWKAGTLPLSYTRQRPVPAASRTVTRPRSADRRGTRAWVDLAFDSLDDVGWSRFRSRRRDLLPTRRFSY